MLSAAIIGASVVVQIFILESAMLRAFPDRKITNEEFERAMMRWCFSLSSTSDDFPFSSFDTESALSV